MNWPNLCWWLVFAVLAILLQALWPGLDFLLPGFIVAVQERNPVQLVWVWLFFMFLQEGMGNMAFGSTLLWYTLVVMLFLAGRSLFETENFLFVFLLCGCLGLVHYLVITVMAGLQDVPVDRQALMDESIFQALFTPFLWRLASLSRGPGLLRHEHQS